MIRRNGGTPVLRLETAKAAEETIAGPGETVKGGTLEAEIGMIIGRAIVERSSDSILPLKIMS